MVQSVEPFWAERCRYYDKLKAVQFNKWNAVFAPQVQNGTDAVIVKGTPHPFVCCVTAMTRNRRVESKTSLPDRPYSLDATISHALTKDRIVDERMRNGQD